MKAALGFRAHSGWAAMVAVCGTAANPKILLRRRVELAGESMHGAVQPYHMAAKLPREEAERFIEDSIASSRQYACRGLDATLGELRAAECEVIACGLLTSASRPLPGVPEILASHALIHTAEGEMFRDVLAYAASQRGIAVVREKDRDIVDVCAKRFRASPATLQNQLQKLGRTLGPPWREDQKHATLVALLALTAGHAMRLDAARLPDAGSR